MIIETDFLDHWKTQLLVEKTGMLHAPLFLLRLWGHCQARRKWQFQNLTTEGLAKLCHWTGDALQFKNILIECKFVHEKKEGILAVHDWEVSNAMLIRCWVNGAKGGRPRKKKTHATTHAQTHAQPSSLSIYKDSTIENSVEEKSKPKSKPVSEKEVIDYCKSLSLPTSDGSYFWNKWLGNGFRNAGQPMRDWQAVIRSWRNAGHLPSQKNRPRTAPPPRPPKTETAQLLEDMTK